MARKSNNSKTKPKKEPLNKMSEHDIQAWDDLYQYVKKIMGYDQSQALSATMALRLKGMLKTRYIENYSLEQLSDYSYEVILNTFKSCYPNIAMSLSKISFRDDMHKFNYILKCVEPHINDIYTRMKRTEKAEEASDRTLSDAIGYKDNTGASYKKVTEDYLPELEGLW